MTLREITMRQLTDALGMSPSAYSMRAAREGWPYRPGPASGGKGRAPRLDDVSALPDDIRQRLLRSPAEALHAAAPELLQRLEASTAELVDYRDALRSEAARFADGTIADPVDEAEIASLSLEIERNRETIDRARGIERGIEGAS